MSLKLYEESDVRGIANAIRARSGSTDTYAIGEMAEAVSELKNAHALTFTGAATGSYDGSEALTINIPSGGSGSGFSGSYNDLTDKPTIPAEVTEQTVSGWGFTKNTGTYSKPSSGIPKSDLATAVQTSLGKADSAVQLQALSNYRTFSEQDTIDDNIRTRVSAVETTLGGNGTVTFSGLTTKGEVEIYGDQPHIDLHYGNSTDDYTSRIIESSSGQLNFMAQNGVLINGKKADTESITLTVNSSRLTDLSYTAKYSSLLGAVFVRIYGKINVDMSVGYDYDVLNIGSRAPGFVAALSTKTGKLITACAKSSGVISLRPMTENITASAGWGIYITGFWFV